MRIPLLLAYVQVKVQYADSPPSKSQVMRKRLFVGGLKPDVQEGEVTEDSCEVEVMILKST